MTKTAPSVKVWLLILCSMVALMVMVGGVTRLTGSGLSIVEWKPIMGAIPPLNEADWQTAFGKYQEYPQYRLQNSGMTLGEFKFIFFWEYFHRLLGRSLGLVFFFPWLFFLVRKKITRKLAVRSAVGFCLGGLQGVVGWVMVQSGLVDRPSVSHIRLAIHLGLAFLILAYLFWIYLDSDESKTSQQKRLISPHLIFVEVLFSLQIIYGAFVAGLKAGYIHNTFPMMSGQWIPSDFFALDPGWINFLENPVSVQFVHRWLAILLWASIVFLCIRNWKQNWAKVLLVVVHLQVLAGIMTLLLHMPLALAVVHQSGASALLLTLVWVHYRMSKHSLG